MKWKKILCVVVAVFLVMAKPAYAFVEWAKAMLFFNIYQSIVELDRCYNIDDELTLCYTNTDDKYIILKMGIYGEVIELP